MFRGRSDEITVLSFGPPYQVFLGHVRPTRILRSGVQLFLHTSTASSVEASLGVGNIFPFISHWPVGCGLSHWRTERGSVH